MRRTYNEVQNKYMIAKANLKALEEMENEVDRKYIEENNIVNPDGSIPRASWAIDDNELSDKAIDECGKLVVDSGLWNEILKARQLLSEAEENLVQYGISLMPNIKEKEILREAVSKNYTIRQKVIDLTFSLDTSTLKK